MVLVTLCRILFTNALPVHEKEVIEQRIIDTNKIESYVESFAGEYFSWQQSQEAIDNRNERLKNYLTEELQQLNMEMVRADIPTSSVVREVQIWNVSANSDTDFKVLFSVEQQLTEGENKKNILSTYSVVVHMDNDGNTVIIQNPTMNSKPEKSNYQPKQVESDGTVDAVMSEEIYVFVELVNPIYIMNDNKVMATVTVKYLDQKTKVTQFSQYELVLVKAENWKIIE